jgi:uncharacterized repeat protein (TIGR03803 family)
MQIPTKFARLFGTLICTTTVALAPRVASAQAPFDVVHGFSSLSGQDNPIAAVIQGTDGNFYGTTAHGGTVFRMTPGGAVTVLHVFTGGTDGSIPYAPLVQARDGNFYGTTVNGGGTSDLGTVFKMTPGGTVTVLHAFVGGTDGAYPYAALIQAADGTFYGTTSEGGAVWNSGTVFQMTPSGNVTVLHAFSGYDGAYLNPI